MQICSLHTTVLM